MGGRNVFIFDLDDTLYQKDKDNKVFSIINSDLLDQLNGIKIVFSNAQYYYCLDFLKKIDILHHFSAVYSADTLEGMKPSIGVYQKVARLTRLTSVDRVFFFDDIGVNLINAKKVGWHTIHIDQNYNKEDPTSISSSKLDFIDMTYNNINNALYDIIQVPRT
jgi:FMN phosphatase YigB (HAD superfamily)